MAWEQDKSLRKGVSFYLPYLYSYTYELERVYQTIQQRLQKKTSVNY